MRASVPMCRLVNQHLLADYCAQAAVDGGSTLAILVTASAVKIVDTLSWPSLSAASDYATYL